MDEAGEERTWIEAMGRGDATALERLFKRHRLRVHRFLARMTGSQAMAEDLLNETFLAAWASAVRYEGRSEPLTWLLSIARHKAASAARKRREETGAPDGAETMIDYADTPETAAQKLDKSQMMRLCIDALSSEHRTILDLVYYQERSIAEAAEILAIPEGTVKTRMFHARKKLSELLKARGVDRGWP